MLSDWISREDASCRRVTTNLTAAAKAANTLIRWLAEVGISIAGTRALRVRGRKTGRPRSVVINVLTVDDVTIWCRRAATRNGRATSGRPAKST